MSFALNLFRQVATEQSGNFFISSASVLAAMAIATAGANGETESELDQVLELNGDYQSKHRSLGELMRALSSGNLTMANRLWVNDQYQLKPEFCNFVAETYNTSVATLDVTDPDNEAARINRWCEKNTNGKIKDIADPATINEMLLATLVNAIAYKGSWTSKFDKKMTRDDSWFCSDGTEITAPRMNQTLECRVKVWDKATTAIALELDGDVAMVLIKPYNENISLESVVESLTEEKIVSVLDAYENEVVVSLVKWKFEGKYDLIPTMEGLGAHSAFVEGVADFDRMTNESIYISGITHKTFISVDEEGAEMAAATKVDFGLESAYMPFVFETNRPFVYFAVDRKTKTILFSGRVSNPNQES